MGGVQGKVAGILEALQREQAAIEAERERILAEKAVELGAERAARHTVEQQLDEISVRCSTPLSTAG